MGKQLHQKIRGLFMKKYEIPKILVEIGVSRIFNILQNPFWICIDGWIAYISY